MIGVIFGSCIKEVDIVDYRYSILDIFCGSGVI